MAINLDLIFAVGGDGTTLRAFRIISIMTPIFSMNVGGNRGILSEVGVDSIDFAINSILAGRYFYDLRIRIQASINGNFIPPALNDIVLTRINLTRTPILSIKLMDDEIKQRMDGIIISTPTGSTGHSYSNGGPVLYEGLNCLILNPIASVSRMPELVVPSANIEIESTHDTYLTIDGQEVFEVTAGQNVKISRFSADAQFIRLRKRGMSSLRNLDFSSEFVLDASAFYTGIPFLSSSKCYTTNLVFEEIEHIKKPYHAIEALLDAGNLKVIEAEEPYITSVINIAKKTGDFSKLSFADLSILALAMQLKITLISDDYAVGNVAALLNIPLKTTGTKGITKVGRWITFCRACGKAYKPNIRECMLCGNKLRRRFKKICSNAI